MSDNIYSQTLRCLLDGHSLDRQQAHQIFGQIMSGELSQPQVAGLLVALAAKGESVDEIAGAALAMREHSLKVPCDWPDLVDTCGTGGTGISTFNVSTAAAMVVAGAGGRVAKHGNRTATRASGSADVLAALGVKIDVPPQTMSQCLQQAGVCFCMAVTCHPAMKHAAPVRKALGVRTIFNLLGPLTNPAGAKRQLMGVFNAALTEPIAQVLAALGSERAMIVHSQDGLDEISIAAPTRITTLADGKISTTVFHPAEAGITGGKLSDLIVASPAESAEVIRQVLQGRTGPTRDIVILNAAAALAVAGKSSDIKGAIPLAQAAIDSGKAWGALEKLISVSNS